MWLKRVESASADYGATGSTSPRNGATSSAALAPAGVWRDRRLWHSFTVRLSFYYASAFVISAALLFALLYFLQATLFDWRERDPIDKFLKQCLVAYEQHGSGGLTNAVNTQGADPNEGPFFVSITFRKDMVLYLKEPSDWFKLPNLTSILQRTHKMAVGAGFRQTNGANMSSKALVCRMAQCCRLGERLTEAKP